MPLLVLNSNTTLTPPQKTELATRLADITEAVLRKRRQVIVVRFDGGDLADRWYSDGVIDPAETTIFELSILITTGTNTEQEKADWIAQAWSAVTGVLGACTHANYISVREIDGTDWGYNGLTQDQRKAQAI